MCGGCVKMLTKSSKGKKLNTMIHKMGLVLKASGAMMQRIQAVLWHCLVSQQETVRLIQRSKNKILVCTGEKEQIDCKSCGFCVNQQDIFFLASL